MGDLGMVDWGGGRGLWWMVRDEWEGFGGMEVSVGRRGVQWCGFVAMDSCGLGGEGGRTGKGVWRERKKGISEAQEMVPRAREFHLGFFVSLELFCSGSAPHCMHPIAPGPGLSSFTLKDLERARESSRESQKGEMSFGHFAAFFHQSNR